MLCSDEEKDLIEKLLEEYYYLDDDKRAASGLAVAILPFVSHLIKAYKGQKELFDELEGQIPENDKC